MYFTYRRSPPTKGPENLPMNYDIWNQTEHEVSFSQAFSIVLNALGDKEQYKSLESALVLVHIASDSMHKETDKMQNKEMQWSGWHKVLRMDKHETVKINSLFVFQCWHSVAFSLCVILRHAKRMWMKQLRKYILYYAILYLFYTIQYYFNFT